MSHYGLAPSRLRTYCTRLVGQLVPPVGLAPSRLRTYCTVSERVEIGKALEGELTPRHGGDRVSEQAGKFSGLNDAPKGDTRDIAAKAAGFGNGKTYATRLHSNSISRLALLTLAIDSIS